MTRRLGPQPRGVARVLRAIPRDRGSSSVEIVVLLPLVFLLLFAMVQGGLWFHARAIALGAAQEGARVAAAESSSAAAGEAARAAAIARSADEASGSATDAASASLANQDVRCVAQSVTVDTGAFAQAPGTPGLVTATVSCQVDMSDLAFPGIPGNRTLEATMSSPIDTSRSRQG